MSISVVNNNDDKEVTVMGLSVGCQFIDSCRLTGKRLQIACVTHKLIRTDTNIWPIVRHCSDQVVFSIDEITPIQGVRNISFSNTESLVDAFKKYLIERHPQILTGYGLDHNFELIGLSKNDITRNGHVALFDFQKRKSSRTLEDPIVCKFWESRQMNSESLQNTLVDAQASAHILCGYERDNNTKENCVCVLAKIVELNQFCGIDMGRLFHSNDKHLIDACGYALLNKEITLQKYKHPGHSDITYKFKERYKGIYSKYSELNTSLIISHDICCFEEDNPASNCHINKNKRITASLLERLVVQQTQLQDDSTVSPKLQAIKDAIRYVTLFAQSFPHIDRRCNNESFGKTYVAPLSLDF